VLKGAMLLHVAVERSRFHGGNEPGHRLDTDECATTMAEFSAIVSSGRCFGG